VFQEMTKFECHFLNGTEQVRFVHRFFYNRQEYAHFDSDLGHFVGDTTPFGELQARHWNSQQDLMERKRAEVHTYCRHNYQRATLFLIHRRVPPRVSISLVPPSSPLSPGRLICSVMDFFPAQVQVRWFQAGRELTGHVVATDVVPNGDWTYQLLGLLETTPQHGDTST
ncbi:PREDICTED: HLA class II histocompatibility antigen, DQ beta 1 chain-like, partial [Acanthisitta chloris]|uniref:HLA class II histocompatibility antigen, DQ beta 1 chain-like n=1 Tax=Acanthisitta chloris TaxID=57068 RepID=UPI0004F0FB6B